MLEPIEKVEGSEKQKPDKRKIIFVIVGVVFVILVIAMVALVGKSLYDRISRNSYTAPQAQQKNMSTIAKVVGGEQCALPTINVPESAFSIGVPAGWIHEIDADTISIREDDRNTTAAFMYTAKLEQDLSASEFLEKFGDVFKTIIESNGGTFSLSGNTESNNTATANVQATVEEGDLKGVFIVEKTTDFVTLKVYWAPVADFTSRESELKQVVNCFSRHIVLTDDMLQSATDAKANSEALIPGSGRYFSYSKPGDWRITGETDSGIDMESPSKDAAVSMAYVTGAAGPIQNRAWAEQTMGQVGIRATLGEAQSIPGIDSNHHVEAYDFSGTFGGKPVQGKITVAVYTISSPLSSYSSPFTGIQIVNADKWDEYKATTQAIQDSIAITDIGSRKDVKLPANQPIDQVGGSSITSSYEYKQAVQDHANNEWADAMRGYQSVESPSTGNHYDAPLNSWNPTGPDGAGYYRELPGGGVEKLEPVE